MNSGSEHVSDQKQTSPKQRRWKSQKDEFDTELTRVKRVSSPASKKYPNNEKNYRKPTTHSSSSPLVPDRRRSSINSSLDKVYSGPTPTPPTPPRGLYSSQRDRERIEHHVSPKGERNYNAQRKKEYSIYEETHDKKVKW